MRMTTCSGSFSYDLTSEELSQRKMIVSDENLDGLEGRGADFEKLIYGLIRAEARACGIAPDHIGWDYRINVPDGGRDVLVRVGNQRPDRRFIPSIKSVWSVKSGADGLSPATFRQEINGHHEVISHLQEGGHYIWCVAPAADHNRRQRLREAADALAPQHRFDTQQIHFFFRDTITDWLNQHIGLIPIFFSTLPRGWKALAEWRMLDRNRNVGWVEFGDRPRLVEEIRNHLLATTDVNVIHLVGWSGIGKTRTVQQACEVPSLEGVLYFPTLEAFKSSVEEHLTRRDGIHAAVVIDEVEIDDFVSLQTGLSDFRDRLRVVTIGTGTSRSITPRAGVIPVSLPDSTADVTQIIRAGDSSLSAEQA
jgi:hypothetical protein